MASASLRVHDGIPEVKRRCRHPTASDLLMQPIGRYLIAGSAFQKSGQRLPDKTRSKIDKFCESFWKVN